tara:strand:+ start:34 stop:495 length:462 start_codon:yes stop_codon:yes gene_type:complete
MISCKINGYENYELFRDGSIYSHLTNRILKQHPSTKGYLHIKLYNNNKKKIHYIHRLLAEYFIPNPDNLPVVDHINRIRDDNRIENLRWVSLEENTHNSNHYKNKILKHKNITKTPYNTFQISFVRYGLLYYKKCKTEEQAILQRDLMLSMFS